MLLCFSIFCASASGKQGGGGFCVTEYLQTGWEQQCFVGCGGIERRGPYPKSPVRLTTTGVHLKRRGLG